MQIKFKHMYISKLILTYIFLNYSKKRGLLKNCFHEKLGYICTFFSYYEFIKEILTGVKLLRK